MSTSELPPNQSSGQGPGEQESIVVDIRKATKEDSAAIVKIATSAGKVHETRKGVIVGLADRLTMTWIAEVDGKPAGYYQARKTGTRYRMMLLRQVGGKMGTVYRAMVEHFKDRLLGKSCNMMCEIRVNKTSDVERGLFESMGFEKSPEMGFDKIIMLYRIKGGRNRLLDYSDAWADVKFRARMGE